MQDTATATIEITDVAVPISNPVVYSIDRKLSVEEQMALVKVLSTPRPLTDTMQRALTKRLIHMKEKTKMRG
jgi:hypothetical protein